MFQLNEQKIRRAELAERRSAGRVAANIHARLFRGNMFYAVTVADLSEKGMFIHTKVYIPAETIFILIFPWGDRLLQLAARVRHFRRDKSEIQGIGIELINPPGEYPDIVMKYRRGQHG